MIGKKKTFQFGFFSIDAIIFTFSNTINIKDILSFDLFTKLNIDVKN